MKLTRKLQDEELEYFIQSCVEEGWVNNLTHLRCLYKSYANDFFVIVTENLIVGFVVALKESTEFGVISNLLILKPYRSLGFAKELFSLALKHLDGCQITLDCVMDKESFYEQFSFKSYFTSSIYKFNSSSFSLPNPHTNVSDVSLNDILDYNKKVKILKKDSYTSCLYASDDSLYKAIYKDRNLSSYALSLKYKDGYIIIISSQDIDESLVLFFNLCKDLEKNTNIYFEVSELEQINLSIVSQLKMQKLSSTTKMYNKILD